MRFDLISPLRMRITHTRMRTVRGEGPRVRTVAGGCEGLCQRRAVHQLVQRALRGRLHGRGPAAYARERVLKGGGCCSWREHRAGQGNFLS